MTYERSFCSYYLVKLFGGRVVVRCNKGEKKSQKIEGEVWRKSDGKVGFVRVEN